MMVIDTLTISGIISAIVTVGVLLRFACCRGSN